MKITIERARFMLLNSHPSDEEEQLFECAVTSYRCRLAPSRARTGQRILDILRGSGVELPEDCEIVP